MLPAPDDDATRTASKACDPNGEEITVCGNTDMSRFRSGPLDDARWAEKPVRPDFKLPGGGRGSVRAANRNVGAVSAPAAKVTLAIPLGRKRAKK